MFTPDNVVIDILEMNAHVCREYMKAVENAKHVYRGSSQEEVEDFLQSIEFHCWWDHHDHE